MGVSANNHRAAVRRVRRSSLLHWPITYASYASVGCHPAERVLPHSPAHLRHKFQQRPRLQGPSESECTSWAILQRVLVVSVEWATQRLLLVRTYT